MTAVNSVTAKRHFSVEEEQALQRDESTSSIVKRDTRAAVDIRGDDYTWLQTKKHQQEVGHNVGPLATKGAATAIEAAEIAGAIAKIEAAAHALHAAGTFLSIAAPVLAFTGGVWELAEAKKHGEEQAQALARDNAHVALIGALDLPGSYKEARFEGDYKHVPRGPNSQAFRSTEALMKDRNGLATLQLHADRGMNAARDFLASGMSVEAYVKAHPEVGKSFKEDAAFREGFQAYIYAKKTMSPDEMKAFDRRLDERDGWYAQSQIQFRV